MITLTARALQEAQRLFHDVEAYRGRPLRVYIEGKGCDGFYYGVSFDEKLPTDISYHQDGLAIIVDPDSIQFLENAVIDFIDDQRGRGFLVENPNHRKFRGKFYKTRKWREILAQKNQNSSSSSQ